ncbi:MAG: hypothetical protein IT246_09955 [Bacteroidia bacterium]|nr:hypothetical protein [Bacteroidia bacterium]
MSNQRGKDEVATKAKPYVFRLFPIISDCKRVNTDDISVNQVVSKNLGFN